MKQNKFIISIVVFLATFLLLGKATAVPAAPSPTCEISARVNRLELDERTTPADYIVYLDNISDIKTVKQEGTTKCDQEYINNIKGENHFFILSLYEYNKHPISKGDEIRVNVHFGGDEWSGGHFLSDIKKKGFNIDLKYIIIFAGIVLLLGLIVVSYLIGRSKGKK